MIPPPKQLTLTPLTEDVEKALATFTSQVNQFQAYCERFHQGHVTLADVTRNLGEASAEAERFFAENSSNLTLEQLEHYGRLHHQLEALTSEVFESHILHNQAIVIEALRNGEYFLVNLTYQAIRSSLYMIYAKQSIKNELDQRLASVQHDLGLAQNLIKVLKALEAAIAPEQVWIPHKVLKTLELYVDYFKGLPKCALLEASHARVFTLISSYVSRLQRAPEQGWTEHIRACAQPLTVLAQQPIHQAQVQAWSSLSPDPERSVVKLARPVKAEPDWPESLNQRMRQLAWALRQGHQSAQTFEAIETCLDTLLSALNLSGGISLYPDAGHRVFELMERYIDAWAQHDFGARPAEVIAHIEACSSKLTGLVQTIYEEQMLDTWRQLAGMFLRLESPGFPTKPLPAELTTAYERLKLLLIHIPVFQQEFIQLEAALIAYVVLAEDSPQSAERLACDEHVFQRIEQQIDALYARQAARASSDLQSHLQLCCETLKPLASDFQLQARLDAWAQMAQLEFAQLAI